MRAGAAVVALLALLAAGACGDGGRGGAIPEKTPSSPLRSTQATRPDRGATMASQLDSALTAQGIRLNEAGRLATHAAAGFEVYWPSGCGQLQSGEPDVVDPTARQEFHYACDRFEKKGRGCSIYVLQNGEDEGGGPPTPPMVVRQVEQILTHYGVRAERQRPLEAPGMEGVEVQALRPSGKGEVWVRGLLVGPSIYVLTAWSTEGGLFDDTEIRDFFASFRLIQ
jgi:hypothetical protein